MVAIEQVERKVGSRGDGRKDADLVGLPEGQPDAVLEEWWPVLAWIRRVDQLAEEGGLGVCGESGAAEEYVGRRRCGLWRVRLRRSVRMGSIWIL